MAAEKRILASQKRDENLKNHKEFINEMCLKVEDRNITEIKITKSYSLATGANHLCQLAPKKKNTAALVVIMPGCRAEKQNVGYNGISPPPLCN